MIGLRRRLDGPYSNSSSFRDDANRSLRRTRQFRRMTCIIGLLSALPAELVADEKQTLGAPPVSVETAAKLRFDDLNGLLSQLRPMTRLISGNQWGWDLSLFPNFIGFYHIKQHDFVLAAKDNKQILFLDVETGSGVS